MSTRGLTGFILDGKWYVMYNHSDSYPEWLGMHVLEFCKSITDWDKVIKNVRNINLIEETEDLYWELHDFQGENILYAVAEGTENRMIDDHLFLGNSLSCEWAYVIDLDDMVLRVFKGKQESYNPYSFLPTDINKYTCDEYGFYPVKELYAYDLYKLPEFILGVTNEFKKQYRAEHRDNLAQALERLK